MKSFRQLFEEARAGDNYWVADAINCFTENLHGLAEEHGISRSELAARLGKTPQYITKIFRGDVNFTIESMVKLTRATGGRLHIRVAPEEREVRFVEVSAPFVAPPRGPERPIERWGLEEAMENTAIPEFDKEKGDELTTRAA